MIFFSLSFSFVEAVQPHHLSSKKIRLKYFKSFSTQLAINLRYHEQLKRDVFFTFMSQFMELLLLLQLFQSDVNGTIIGSFSNALFNITSKRRQLRRGASVSLSADHVHPITYIHIPLPYLLPKGARVMRNSILYTL